jgi:hypothetical protein
MNAKLYCYIYIFHYYAAQIFAISTPNKITVLRGRAAKKIRVNITIMHTFPYKTSSVKRQRRKKSFFFFSNRRTAAAAWYKKDNSKY